MVGHNVYILAYQLSQYKKELKIALDKATRQEPAIRSYADNTAQIEVTRITVGQIVIVLIHGIEYEKRAYFVLWSI